MASYNFKIKQFLFFLLTTTNFFSVPTPFTSAIFFNFTNFISGDSKVSNIITFDRAFAEDGVIQLSGSKVGIGSVGRATYFKPMHRWDKASGNLTDFTTHFSFVIDSRNNTNYGDGLAFFLAPTATSSIVPNTVTPGSSLGLTTDDQTLNSTYNPFVAVEFDIYPNQQWDPLWWPGVHVGIDINSMQSVATMSWSWANYSITHGRINKAWISYNSTSHNLSVLLTGFINDSSTREQSLSHNVDLRVYLPEWVTLIGFSAATGFSHAMHTIRTWNFSSTLEENVTKPTVADSPRPNPAPNRRKNNMFGLAMGLGVNVPFLFGGMALILFGSWKRTRSHTEEDLAFDRSVDDEFQRETGPKRFSFKELAHATNNFNDEEKLGQVGLEGFIKDF